MFLDLETEIHTRLKSYFCLKNIQITAKGFHDFQCFYDHGISDVVSPHFAIPKNCKVPPRTDPRIFLG